MGLISCNITRKRLKQCVLGKPGLVYQKFFWIVTQKCVTVTQITVKDCTLGRGLENPNSRTGKLVETSLLRISWAEPTIAKERDLQFLEPYSE